MSQRWGIGKAAASLVELILPRPCAGCGGEAEAGGVLCARCQQLLRRVPHPIDRPRPLGFPAWALGPYSDTRRGIIIAMKERGNRAVRSVGLCLQHLHASPFVPAPDQGRILLVGFGGGQCGGIETLPEAGQRISKSRNTAFGGNARPGEDHQVARVAQRGELCRRDQGELLCVVLTPVPELTEQKKAA